MNFDEYRRYDATGLAKLVADKEVSPAELLTLARGRAAAVNPKINAIVRDVPAALPLSRSAISALVPRLAPMVLFNVCCTRSERLCPAAG